MKTKFFLAASISASLFVGMPYSTASAASAGQKCLKAGTLSGTKIAPLVCAMVGGKLVWQSSKKGATTTVKETVAQSNAKKSATSYLKYSAFSRTGLIGQLEFEGFSTADATYGVDAQNADWNAQAAKSAKSYLKYSSFSRIGLIDQLVFEGYTQAQAEYGVSTTGLQTVLAFMETFALLYVGGYLVPTFVAIYRSMPNKGSVIVVNVFLGWTFIGWVVALSMACGSKKSV